ncbi:MAG: hypothetical protein NTV19_17965 [Burkholderiales bacterium]|nr:hypothetical protein [Burkholderiales bacterium]
MLAEEPVRPQAQHRQVIIDAAQKTRHIDVAALRIHDRPDEAVAHLRGQPAQPVSVLVQGREAFGAGHAAQASVEVVVPGVIGARQTRLAAHRLLLGDQPRAAMAADIEQDIDLALTVAHDQQR